MHTADKVRLQVGGQRLCTTMRTLTAKESMLKERFESEALGEKGDGKGGDEGRRCGRDWTIAQDAPKPTFATKDLITSNHTHEHTH